MSDQLSTPLANLAVVIPAYNEAGTIRDVARSALRQCRNVIIVDDGSTDTTVEAVTDLPVTLVRHPVNMGKAASLWDGMQRALEDDREAVITLDGDGQHSPDDIPRLVEQFQHHPEKIIIGSRLANRKGIPAKRYYANKVANFWISWAAGYRIDDSQSGFRLYPAALLRQLSPDVSRSKSFVFESEVLIKAAHLGVHSVPVPIDAVYAENARPSHFRGVRDITLITRMVAQDLITHALNLPGLYRAWLKPGSTVSHYEQTGLDGYAMLLLSCAVILLIAGITLVWPAWRVYRTARSATTRLRSVPFFLLPGMRLYSDAPTHEYRARLDRVCEGLRGHPESTVIILGGLTGRSTISEAEAGKRYLLRLGVAAGRIVVEEHSRNTLENLQQARTLLRPGDRECCLVSSRYHLARCHALAEGLAIRHQLCAAEDRLELDFITVFRILKEAFHLHWYYTGKYWATWTRNKRMLARIT